jgi:uncharacterized protein
MHQAILTTEPTEQTDSSRRSLIASPWHTLFTVCYLAAHAYVGTIWAAQSRAGLGPSRSFLYLRIILLEFVALGIVVAGVKLRGASMQAVLGKRWQSAGQVFLDLGLGICLLFLSTMLVSIIGGHGGGGSANRLIGYLLPQGSLEMALWIIVSISAGICEEAVYRGYLQPQLGALTNNVWVGMVLSAAAFGGVHIYQGVQRASVIAMSAVLFGWFAHWRKTVRPGMFAHAFQDGVAPLLLKMMRGSG